MKRLTIKVLLTMTVSMSLVVPLGTPVTAAQGAGGTTSKECPESVHVLVGEGDPPTSKSRARVDPVLSVMSSAYGAGRIQPERGVGAPAASGTKLRQWKSAISGARRSIEQSLDAVRASSCLSTAHVVLFGYSSGALALRGALTTMSSSELLPVDAVVLIGDPARDTRDKTVQNLAYNTRSAQRGVAMSPAMRRYVPKSSRRALPAFLRGKVLSYCHGRDAICRGSGTSARSPRTAISSWRVEKRRALYAQRYIRNEVDAALRRVLPKAPVGPRTTISGKRTFMVGDEVTVSLSVSGAHPPFDISASGDALDHTGLRLEGSTILGTPTREFSDDLSYVVRDALGRVESGNLYLSATNLPPVVREVDLDQAQDADGSIVGNPAVSEAGRFVAFVSNASGRYETESNAVPDVYLRDTSDGSTRLISRSWSGGQADGASADPEITPSGDLVVFDSSASNLVVEAKPSYYRGVYAFSTLSGELERLGDGYDAEVSADGTIVAFRGNNNGVVVVNRTTGTSTEIKPTVGSSVVEMALAGNGKWLVLTEQANGTNQVVRVGTDGGGASVIAGSSADNPSISFDGSRVAYGSSTDLYLWDARDNAARPVVEDLLISSTELSADGDTLMYEIVSCRGQAASVGIYYVPTQGTRRVWDARNGSAGFLEGFASTPDLSPDGRYVAFTSVPTNGPVDTLLAALL